jgi:hypothetical protein
VFFDALHAVEQFVHGQLLVRHVLEEMYNIASHVDDRGFDAADALPGVRGIGLNRSDVSTYRPEVLNNQIIGAHLLSPFLPGVGNGYSTNLLNKPTHWCGDFTVWIVNVNILAKLTLEQFKLATFR